MTPPTAEGYPKELIICDEVYKIRFCKVVARHPAMFGTTDPNTRIIRIKRGMTDYETFLTFIHEVIHAMEFEYEFTLDHSLVYKLEKVVAQLLIQNF